MRFFKTNGERDGGAAMVEYGLIVAVIALLSVSAVTLVGERTEETFDEVTAALDHDGTSFEPGGESESPGGDDTDSEHGDDTSPAPGDETVPEEDEEVPPPAEEDDEPEDEEPEDEESEHEEPGDDDQGAPEETEVSVPSVANTGASAEWNGNSRNYHGVWAASVEYANTSSQTQYLTLVVTMVEEDGMTETATVEGFELPANSSATFTQGDNEYKVTGNGKDKSGTKRVEIQVVSITTTGPDGTVDAVDIDSEPVGIEVPSP